MVSSATMFGMGFQVVFALLFPIAVFLYFRKKERISFKPALVGVAVFIVFAQILEKLLHVYMLQLNPQTVQLLSNPWLYALYGGLAAGLFEEVGRYVGFRTLLKGADQRKDGISYGIGHGGIETVLLGAVIGIQSLVFAVMLNSGTLESALPAPEIVSQIKKQLTETPFYMFLLVVWERGVALFLQIALSLVVLHSIRSGKKIFLLYSILLHAAINFVPALYQAKVASIWAAEAVLLLAIPVIWYIFKKSKSWRAA